MIVVRLQSSRRLPSVKPLWLTREEAFGLTELSVASIAAGQVEEEGALVKLGDLCRAFLRHDASPHFKRVSSEPGRGFNAAADVAPCCDRHFRIGERK
jgi:hypothetical protein